MDYSHQILSDIIDRKILIQLLEGAKKPLRNELYDDLDGIAKLVRIAQKFDVSAIRPTFDKNLILTAAEALHHGMLRLPFDVCFFDFGKAQATGMGVDDPVIMVGTCSLAVKDVDLIKIYAFVQRKHKISGNPAWCTFPFTLSSRDGQPMDQAFYGGMLKSCNHISASEMPKYIKDPVLYCAQMTLSAIVCINSDSVKNMTELAPLKLNAARIKRGRQPLSDHTIVTIDMAALAARHSAEGGTHASPRLHWRRGHIRTLPSGKKTEVRACLVGNPAAGMVTHDYKVINEH